ncbi:hypothetical protein ACFWOB_14140 [Streptomyces sp. NPDC058420]|uniref:hypothetical protein n=1 Tax=Streptomyces sp. NPDC058420 TaxID=3346489 RepID=UPI003656251F
MSTTESGSAVDLSERVEQPDQQVWQGVSSLLDQYLHLGSDDRVILLYARSAREPAAWVTGELGLRGVPVALLDLDSLSQRTVTPFSEKLTAASAGLGARGSRLVVLCLEYDIVMPSVWIRQALAPLTGTKVEIFRVVMAGADFFRQGVTTSPATLNNINAGLLQRLRSAERFTVTSSSGSELDIVLDPERYRWVSSRGISREGAFVLLPAGEVATFPARISGTLVADGAFNSTAFTKLDARLGDHPVIFEIEDGVMVDYRCDHPLVKKFVDRFLRVPNADRVGELGFGTNIGIDRFVSLNSHLNERHPGVHIGFGQSNQRRGTVHSCDVHVDFIASDCAIEISNEAPLRSGDFKDLTGEHPVIEAGVYDEDLDGDCCGLFSAHDSTHCQ